MLKLLIEHKVDLKATTSLGDHCLTIAQKNGKPELIMMLAGKGKILANSTITNINYYRTLSAAKFRQDIAQS